MEALWSRQTTAGLAPGAGPTQTGRLTAEVGYGFAAFARGLLTPYAGDLAGGRPSPDVPAGHALAGGPRA